jgi:hypothetical protein
VYQFVIAKDNSWFSIQSLLPCIWKEAKVEDFLQHGKLFYRQILYILGWKERLEDFF